MGAGGCAGPRSAVRAPAGPTAEPISLDEGDGRSRERWQLDRTAGAQLHAQAKAKEKSTQCHNRSADHGLNEKKGWVVQAVC